MAGTFAAGCLGGPDITGQISHRPWPLPQARWVLSMRWHDLLFLHWPIRPELIRPLIPSALDLDTFDGWCWIAVVPFHMTGVRPRYVPISIQSRAIPCHVPRHLWQKERSHLRADVSRLGFLLLYNIERQPSRPRVVFSRCTPLVCAVAVQRGIIPVVCLVRLDR